MRYFRYGVTAGAEAFATSLASGIEGVLVSINVFTVACPMLTLRR